MQQEPNSFSATWNVLGYVVQYHKTFSYASPQEPKSNVKRHAYRFMWCQGHHTTIHSQNSSDLKKKLQLQFNSFSPTWKLLEYVDQYHSMFYAFFQGPTGNVKRNASRFIWCQDHLSTAHKAVTTWKHCNCRPEAFLQPENC